MKALRLVLVLSVFVATVLLYGCGDGNVGVPNKGTQKSLYLSDSVKGIYITLILPAGITVRTDASGAVQDGVVVFTGKSDSQNLYVEKKYTAASGDTKARLRIGVISGTKIEAGDLFTISCEGYAPDAVFSYEDLKVFDATTGAEIPATAEIVKL